MSTIARVFQVDAFTQQALTGNPAGVVVDADHLNAAQMQAIARELNNGDTAFLLAPDAGDHDLRVRFFTPRTEASFVGHATLAAHAVLSVLGRPPAPRQKQRSGIVQVAVESGASPLIRIRQPPAALGRQLSADELRAVLAALHLDAGLLDARCTPAIVGESSTRLMLAVRDSAVLQELQPDLTQLAGLSASIGAAGYFLFTLRPDLPGCHTEARMFCPALGIPEDPVSGNAHGMLAMYLHHHQLLPVADGTVGFIGSQGRHVGRPGQVQVQWSTSGGKLQHVSIAGHAVIVFDTTMTID